MGWCPVVVQFGIQILILAFHFNSLCVQVDSLDKIIFTKCIIAGIFVSFCFCWKKKKCKQSFEFCQYLNESSQRRKLNIRCLTNCRSIWSKDSGYKYAFCLEFTYMYNQEIFGLFVNRPPLLLLYRLPELKSFRVLWQNNSLSPTDPGCPCQSYKSKGVENNVLS